MGDIETFPFLDPALPLEERVDDIVSRMTLEEKVSQMIHDAPAVERLGIPRYDWWNECLHGVAFAGKATVFPQAVGLAATFDDDLVNRVAAAVSDEARAIHHEAARRGERVRFKGLTYWTPNINLFRDPRWGRGQETYGEDPFLASRLAVAFVKGLQGNHPRYLKLVATPKHFAVHSGPEKERHRFDAKVGEKDLRKSYLPAFHAAVTEAGAASVMAAYNRTNSEPCCASPTLLGRILREEWGFEGYVVSDCWAIRDFHLHHKITGKPEESCALAVREGCDLNCGDTYPHLLEAVKKGLVSEAEIDRSVRRLFTARFRLGMFDPEEDVEYARIPFETVDSQAHRALALEAARKSIVLLKNENRLLPLSDALGCVAVIGPNADDVLSLKGNYFGTAPRAVTPLAGIQNRLPGARILAARGCDLARNSEEGFAQAVRAAEEADVAVVVLGLNTTLEGEEGTTVKGDYVDVGDRRRIDLPGSQQALLEAVVSAGKPTVLVLLNGSALAVPWAKEHVPAMVEAWYPGQEGGTALAEVLFGDVNPGGRLPVTFYEILEDLPSFDDYALEGRTYRYFRGKPLFPFGHGLSYTRFVYGPLRLEPERIEAGGSVEASVEVTNAGEIAGDEVVQLYVTDREASVPVPIRSLVGFRRIHLAPGETRTAAFTITPRSLSFIDGTGARRIEPGTFLVTAGGSQPGFENRTGGCTGTSSAVLEVFGGAVDLEY